ncbi:hypothetical protein ACOMHN_061454 [Nucella lapillus]
MSKKQKATDPSRFEGNGISYRAKLIGIEDVLEARGDKMCQETIQKLKGVVKASGQHKQKIFVNVTLEGLKIIDGTALSVLHTHPVHQISFISRDVTDSRAFGYVFGSGDGSHKFFGIKTASSAEAVVLALRDLFQTVYEMKKLEMEEAKAKATAGMENNEETDAKETADATPAKTEENAEQVAKHSDSPATNPEEQEEVVANLLDLEDQVDTILKGIEQIKNLDLEDMTSEETPGQASSTTTTTTTTSKASAAPAAVNDPWGMTATETSSAPFGDFGTETSSSPFGDFGTETSSSPFGDFGAETSSAPWGDLATETSSSAWGDPLAETSKPPPKSASSSALDDLEQLSNPLPPPSNPFGGMQAFSAVPSSTPATFFGMGQPGMVHPGMAQPGMGQPGMVQPGISQPGMVQPGMAHPGMVQPSMGQPGMVQPGISQPGMVQPGMAQPGMVQPGMGQPGMVQPGMGQPGMGQPGMGQPGMPFGQQGMMGASVGLPVRSDPFGDPFNTSQTQQQPRQAAPQMMASSGGQFGMQAPFASPFPATGVAPAPAQPFPGTMAAPGPGGMHPGFGRDSPSFAPFGTATPAAGMGMQMGPQGGSMADPFQPSGDNSLQPAPQEKPRAVSPAHANLFGDLLDIKKSGGAQSTTKTPKEMFPQPQKKSLNEMKGKSAAGGGGATQASVVFDQDPFSEDPFGSIDTMLNTIASSDTDPFGTPHITASSSSSSSPPPLPPPSLPHPPPAPPDPSPAQPNLTLSTPSSKESSPETRFDVPDEPPPPLPPHLMLSAAAPSPPLRPPPIPNRPAPKTHKHSPAKSVSRSFSTPPPMPTTPRPSSSVASSSPASELSASDSAPSGVKDVSAQNSPRVSYPHAPPSPSHSWGSSGSLSHSSSQKSLEKAVVTADSDDPFGVTLRSKKSFSSADGASKRSSRSSSSGKLSVKSDYKISVAVDPFGVPIKDRTSGSDRTGSKVDLAGVDNPFSSPAFSDSVSVSSSSSPWEAFGDHAGNGVTDLTKKPVAPDSRKTTTTSNSSPFGDSFFSTPINGKPQS